LAMMKLLIVCLALCLCEATSLGKLITKHKLTDRKQLSHGPDGDTTSDPANTNTVSTNTDSITTNPVFQYGSPALLQPPARLRLTDDELQTVLNTPPTPITPEEQPFKEAYENEINKLAGTLTLLAKFYGVFIPDPAIDEIEQSQLKAVNEKIMNSAIEQAKIPETERLEKTRTQIWEAEIAQGITKDAWYQQYYKKVYDAKEAAPHLSVDQGPGAASTHGDWTFSLNWVGSTDSSHDSDQDQDKARRLKEEEDLARQLGDIPPTDPLSIIAKHAYEQRKALRWEDVFDKINDVRTKEEQAAAMAALHATTHDSTTVTDE